MTCYQCGVELGPQASFCTSCGAKQRQQPIPASGPAPDTPAVSRKTGLIISLILFVITAAVGVAAWLYFFPPGVYIYDTFRTVHDDLKTRIQQQDAQISNEMLETHPQNEKFDSFLYESRIPDRATIEGTIIWKEGDSTSVFGLLCCALDSGTFTAFLITPHGEYFLNSREGNDWHRLTGFLRLPADIRIERNVPYHLKMQIRGNLISLYLNGTHLATITDSVEHSGKAGLYAQGGKEGNTIVLFDEFKVSRK